jgi:hypothetical protein
MLDLRTSEPEIFEIKEIIDNEEIVTVVEIVPLLTEDIEITLDFMETKDKLDMVRSKANAKAELKYKKEKGKSKKEKPEKLPLAKEDKKEIDTIIFKELLPVMNNMVDKGLVRHDNPEKIVSLPRRYRTMPTLMKIATKILEVTSEGDKEETPNEEDGEGIPLGQNKKN